MTIAQRLSAGESRWIPLESVKRTTEQTMNLQHLASAVRFTDYDCGYVQTPPMNRWAIFIRRLRRLLQQSPDYAEKDLITFGPSSKTLHLKRVLLRSHAAGLKSN